MTKQSIVIGAGFSGFSSAISLASKGFDVRIFEKNLLPGGRARKLEAEGFTFDMGPTWYWMPDVFEKFFAFFDRKPEDYYKLIRLDPGYRVFFDKNDYMDIPADESEIYTLFERTEKGAGKKLKKFLDEAEIKYLLGINKVVYNPGKSILEFADWQIISGVLRTKFFRSLSSYVHKEFKNPRLRRILEFPVLFLGAMPEKTPALYSLMNYADLKLGTWYPMGGMFEVVKAFEKLAVEMGVDISYGSEIEQIEVSQNKVNSVVIKNKHFYANHFIASADYNYVDTKLLPAGYSNYSDKYWESRVLAPSALIFYIGVNKKILNLLHHNLFFDTDFSQHAKDIYNKPKWPDSPAIYVSCGTKTDESLAPPGHENLIVLIPVAPGLEDHGKVREYYYNIVIDRIERISGSLFRENIVYHKSYAHADFIKDYHAFKGNAYGLANTIRQTANFKPKIRNKKLRNLYYCGQLTTPGPGVPPALISGQIVANEIYKDTLSKYS